MMKSDLTDVADLKPCPFCDPEDSDPVLVNGGPGNFFVMCNGCNCETDDGSKERVVEIWNTRPETEALEKVTP